MFEAHNLYLENDGILRIAIAVDPRGVEPRCVPVGRILLSHSGFFLVAFHLFQGLKDGVPSNHRYSIDDGFDDMR